MSVEKVSGKALLNRFTCISNRVIENLHWPEKRFQKGGVLYLPELLFTADKNKRIDMIMDQGGRVLRALGREAQDIRTITLRTDQSVLRTLDTIWELSPEERMQAIKSGDLHVDLILNEMVVSQARSDGECDLEQIFRLLSQNDHDLLNTRAGKHLQGHVFSGRILQASDIAETGDFRGALDCLRQIDELEISDSGKKPYQSYYNQLWQTYSLEVDPDAVFSVPGFFAFPGT